MEKIEFEAEAEKTTKNTIRYQEVTDTHPPYVNTLYIQKWALAQLILSAAFCLSSVLLDGVGKRRRKNHNAYIFISSYYIVVCGDV